MTGKRYEVLDALRGLAALAVVFFHFTQVKLAPTLVPHGYLAVDFFFILSGFVVAHAYENALQTRLSWRTFMLRRIIRLYPLALLGAMMGLAILLLKWRFFPDKVDPISGILLSGFFNALMLPTFFGGEASHHEIFPGNGPLWTLFFELLINALWAWLGVRMRTWQLATASCVSAIAVAVLSFHFHTANIGFDIATFCGGLARVCFGFTLGVVIFRMHDRFTIPAALTAPGSLSIAMVVIFTIPCSPEMTVVYDLAAIFVLLPAIVVFGATKLSAGRLGFTIGEFSYPGYVLHFPILLIGSGLHQVMGARLDLLIFDAILFVVVVVFAGLAARFYDRPIRNVFFQHPPAGWARRWRCAGVWAWAAAGVRRRRGS